MSDEPDDVATASHELLKKIHPLVQEAPSEVLGCALAGLIAGYLAGHTILDADGNVLGEATARKRAALIAELVASALHLTIRAAMDRLEDTPN